MEFEPVIDFPMQIVKERLDKGYFISAEIRAACCHSFPSHNHKSSPSSHSSFFTLCLSQSFSFLRKFPQSALGMSRMWKIWNFEFPFRFLFLTFLLTLEGSFHDKKQPILAKTLGMNNWERGYKKIWDRRISEITNMTDSRQILSSSDKNAIYP